MNAEQYLNELNDNQGAIAQWEMSKRKITAHLSKMKPLFERSVSSQANARQVERSVEQVEIRLRHDTEQITQLSAGIQAAQFPKVMLEVVDGKVQRGHYLR